MRQAGAGGLWRAVGRQCLPAGTGVVRLAGTHRPPQRTDQVECARRVAGFKMRVHIKARGEGADELTKPRGAGKSQWPVGGVKGGIGFLQDGNRLRRGCHSEKHRFGICVLREDAAVGVAEIIDAGRSVE